MDIKELIEAFLADSEKMDPDLIYNEFSLQFELGIFLRENGYKVYFEKNVESEDICKGNGVKEFVKKEMDLYIIDGKNKYAIELKFPTNGFYKKRMFHFIKDIRFMEQVKELPNFEKTYCLTLVKNDSVGEKFFKGNDTGIFTYFQNEIDIPSEEIKNPSKKSKKGKSITLDKERSAVWKNINDKFWYYLIEI